MVTKDEYEAYKTKVLVGLKELLNSTGTRPVLFAGAGISRRYLGAPSWLELLRKVAQIAGIDDEAFNFLSQKANNDPGTIGSLLVETVRIGRGSSDKSIT